MTYGRLLATASLTGAVAGFVWATTDIAVGLPDWTAYALFVVISATYLMWMRREEGRL